MNGGRTLRKVCVLISAIFLACPIFAANETREQKRLEACGQVFKEILDIPDGIPKDLLNKAECVIVIPSVLKFAIGIGGDFGRGAITCRTGQHFTGRWSPPEVASNADCELQDRRNHNDAFGLVEQILRNPVGDVQNLLEHLATGFESLLLPGFICCEYGTREENGADKNTDFSQSTTPVHLVDCCAVRLRRKQV